MKIPKSLIPVLATLLAMPIVAFIIIVPCEIGKHFGSNYGLIAMFIIMIPTFLIFRKG